MTAAPALPAARPWRAAVVSAIGVTVFVLIRMITTRGPGGFPVAERLFVHPGAPKELRIYGSGYDGQFVYRLTLDPFTRAVTAHGISFDMPAYRQQRIATALLAHVVAWLPGIGDALAIVIVNALAVVVAWVAASYLVADFGRSSWWVPVLAVPACMPISLGRDLTEPVAWAGVLVGLLLARRRRWFFAAVALTVAVLSRETSLVVVAGLGIEALLVLARRRPDALPRLWLLLPIVVEGAWQLWLRHVWGGGLPMFSGPANNSAKPVLGILQNFFIGIGPGSLKELGLGVTYLIERCVLVALMVTAAAVLIRRASRVEFGEATAWLFAVLVALSLRRWDNDVSFLRATYESWGLSVLLVLAARRGTRWPDAVLRSAGFVSAGVAVLYAVRV